MNNIFLCQHFTKRIQSSADGTSRLVTSSLTCLWAFSCASIGAHSPVHLWQRLTSSQIYKHSTFWPWRNLSVQEEGFPVWTSLLLFTVCQLVASLAEDGFCGNGNILKNTDNIIGKKWTWSCWKDIEIIERGSLSYIWTNCARSVKAIAALWWWDFAQRKVKYNKPKSLSCRKMVLD